MVFALLGLVLLIIILLLAVKVGIKKEQPEDQASAAPVIHKSGIYSIVRRSPRELIAGHKPTEEAIRQYLASQNEDIHGRRLTDTIREDLLNRWKSSLDKSISEIERGDADGVEFYFYGFTGDDPACENHVPKDCFVSREQMYKYPITVPPFHLGCLCEIKAYQGEQNICDTATDRVRLFDENALPRLPEWKQIVATQ
jgi:hypothetical protein